MLTQLTGRNVFVTGGNSGIGKAIVEEFASEGASKIVFTYCNPENAEKANLFAGDVFRTYRCEARAIQLDVTDDAQLNRAIEVSLSFFKGLPDILVNNAGIIDLDPFLEVSRRNAVKVMETNFFGPFFLTQKVARLWVEAQKAAIIDKKPLKEYVVISIGSISDTYVTGIEAYEASKGALDTFMRGLVYTLKNIRAINIRAGLVRTRLNSAIHDSDDWNKRVATIPVGRSGKPEEIASLVVHAARNPFINGPLLIDGGVTIAHNIERSKLHAKL